MKRLASYFERQKAFWNVRDEETAKFGRVAADRQLSEANWEAAAAKDMDLLLEGIEPQPGWTCLEIGCGVGRLLEELRRRGPFERLIGLDISESMIEFARKRLGADPKVSLFVNSGCDLKPVADSSVDFAYSYDVFIHLFDLEIVSGYLREARRVLKPDGVLRFNIRRFDPDEAFADTLGGTIAKWKFKLGLDSPGRHRWHPSEEGGFNGNAFTLREVRQLMRRCGLSMADIRSDGFQFWCTVR